jgi:hypothetical protein
MRSGYSAVIGLRDVYPSPRADIPSIQAVLAHGLPNNPVISEMHLAIMEVEAWFLSETTHFERVSETLKLPFIVGSGFDIVSNFGDSWEHPTEMLDRIYKLASMSYIDRHGSKTRQRILRTINALSYEEIYITVRQQLPALDDFLTSVENAFS